MNSALPPSDGDTSARAATDPPRRTPAPAPHRARRALLALVLTALGAAGCFNQTDGAAATAPLAPTPDLALGAPTNPVPVPADNPGATAAVALGRNLFWDPILSGNRDIACAGCHHPAYGYTDGLRTAIGTGGTGLGPARTIAPGAPTPARNTPTVLNTAFNGLTLDGPSAAADAPMFWDNRMRSLEHQALGPIGAAPEMRGANYDAAHILPEIAGRLGGVPEYVAQFEAAFGPGAAVSPDNVARAIAAFERSLVATDSSFDRYMRGDASALSAQQVHGMQVFRAAGCGGCHAGAMFSDYQLHDLGVPDPRGAAHDAGDGQNRFRTPSLRFATRTAPYMHNGVLASLDEVYLFYRAAAARSPDPAMRVVQAPTGTDTSDVTAFLASLSDGTFDGSIPDRVPSGLPVGGAIR